jgi:hypothetical protein
MLPILRARSANWRGIARGWRIFSALLASVSKDFLR